MIRTRTAEDLPIPATIDDLTPEWLSAALGITVRSATQERIGEGVGIVGELARVHLAYEAPHVGPATVVAKMHTRAVDMLPLAVFYGFFTTEVGFYRDTASGFGVRTPHCYYADVSDDGSQCVLLLEDLAGSVAFDQLAGCPPERADVVIDTIAGMHARRWNDESLKEIAWLRPIDNPAYMTVGDQITASLPVLVARHPGLPEDAVAAARLYAKLLPAMMRWSMTRPFTISHTDLRLDNLFFDHPDGSALVILDWQLTVRGPGSFDMSYFIGQSLTTQDRRAHEQRLVRRWHDALIAHGVHDYTFTDAWYDYRMGLAAQFGISASVGLIEPVNERAAKLMESIVVRNFTAAHEHNVLAMLQDWQAANT